jgi:hypothetical protein
VVSTGHFLGHYHSSAVLKSRCENYFAEQGRCFGSKLHRHCRFAEKHGEVIQKRMYYNIGQ